MRRDNVAVVTHGYQHVEPIAAVRDRVYGLSAVKDEHGFTFDRVCQYRRDVGWRNAFRLELVAVAGHDIFQPAPVIALFEPDDPTIVQLADPGDPFRTDFRTVILYLLDQPGRFR